MLVYIEQVLSPILNTASDVISAENWKSDVWVPKSESFDSS